MLIFTRTIFPPLSEIFSYPEKQNQILYNNFLGETKVEEIEQAVQIYVEVMHSGQVILLFLLGGLYYSVFMYLGMRYDKRFKSIHKK